MGRRLLYFPILRTRSARKKLVSWSVIVLLGLVALQGCDDASSRGAELGAASPADPTRDEPVAAAAPSSKQPSAVRNDLARRAAEELEALEKEAGIERGHDPQAPGGDLARDIAAFTTLEACVRAHRITDPVLGDAIDTLGYDTLVGDACRILAALKAKDGKLCSPIAASPLRHRCETQVAVLAGEPALCPVAGGGGGVQAREPVCLARASRDERLCAAALPADRAACKALVRGSSSDCGTDETCVRQVERYRPLLEKPASRAPFPARLHVVIASDPGKAEKYDGAFDLDETAAAGAVARPMGDKVRLTIGTPKNALWPSWDSPRSSPLVFLSLSLPSKMPTSGDKAGAAPEWTLGPGDLAFDLLVPQVALLSGSLTSERHVVFDNVSVAQGSPIRLTLTTKVSDATRTFRVRFELETFVRDGIDPRPAARKVP
jgi:hypothetical protein